jgi:hypothetical protein
VYEDRVLLEELGYKDKLKAVDEAVRLYLISPVGTLILLAIDLG